MLFRNSFQFARLARCSRPDRRPTEGSTLIEVMAVAVVIGILAGMLLSLNRYVNLRTNISRTKTEIAALGTAVEMYRMDYGTYPTSSLVRFDTNSFGVIYAQVTNSALLYAQLVANGSKRYINPTSKLWTNQFLYTTNGLSWLTNNINYFIDPWGKPYNYFSTRTPTTSQVNQASFDLFSAGPDRRFNTTDDIEIGRAHV